MLLSMSKVSQQHQMRQNDLEQDKRSRQEQSRAAVMSGSRALEHNFFISKGAARALSYTFKG